MPRKFPPPGLYISKPVDWMDPRAMLVTGDKKGNLWFDSVWPNAHNPRNRRTDWQTLTWTSVPTPTGRDFAYYERYTGGALPDWLPAIPGSHAHLLSPVEVSDE